MKSYRKKPVVVQAEQIYGEFTVHTLEGDMKGKSGDYLIIGIEGEQYPCKKEIFEKIYEEVESELPQTRKVIKDGFDFRK